MKKVYLLVFSIASFLAWSACCFSVLTSIFSVTPQEYWETKKYYVMVAEVLCSFEIFHSLFGITPSPFLPPLFLNSAKLMVVFFVTNRSEASQQNFSVFLPPLVWSIGESPRALFYVLKLFTEMTGIEFPQFMKLVTMIRYNLFVVLLWVGMFAEIHQCYLFLDEYKKIAFHPFLYWFMVTYLTVGPFTLFPVIYLRLLKQRAKVKKNGYVVSSKKKKRKD